MAHAKHGFLPEVDSSLIQGLMYAMSPMYVTIIAQDVKVSHFEKHVLPTFACLPSVAALALPGCHRHKRHKHRLLKLRLVTPAARVQHWCLPTSGSLAIRAGKCCPCDRRMRCHAVGGVHPPRLEYGDACCCLPA